MNNETPTQKYLESLDACHEARSWVADQTLEQAWLKCTRLDWLQWLVAAPALAEYKRVTAAAYAEYDRVRAAARAEYDRVTAPADAEYQRVTAAALAEYERVTAPARAEYDRVRAAALAEYDRVRAAAGACRTCDELREKFSCPAVPTVSTDCTSSEAQS